MPTQTELELLNYFKDHSKVSDVKRGYIFAPDVNVTIQGRFLRLLVDCWVEKIEEMELDFEGILGLPTAGNPLAAALLYALSEKTDKYFMLPTRKHESVPSWEKLGAVLTYEADSFTTDKPVFSYIGGSQNGDRKKRLKVLVVDDVLATGKVSHAAVKVLKDHVDVQGFFGGFGKRFQDGFTVLQTLLPKEMIYVPVIINSLTDNGEMIFDNE